MRLRWLLQGPGGVPPPDTWLSESERAVAARFRVAKRRADWLLGRFTAKRALLLAGLPPPASRIEVLPLPSGAPQARTEEGPVPFALSISHSGGRALCLLGPSGSRVGCDLERVEARGTSFALDYFTESERGLLASLPAAGRALYETLLWSAKESALKAIGEGLRRSTHDVSVLIEPEAPEREGWRPFRVWGAAAVEGAAGWWRADGDDVVTVLSEPASAPPEPLGEPSVV